MVAVIGEGAWGTAIATLLAENNHTVFLWCHDPKVKESIEKTRYNERYLPGIFLKESIIPIVDLNGAIGQSSWIFEAIPVKFLRSVLVRIDASMVDKKAWVVLSKGIENETLLFPTQIIDDVFKNHSSKAVLFGPSFAKELAEQQITAVTVATEQKELGVLLQQLLNNSYFKTYVSDDVVGVQACGALKNIVALLVGMLDGAGYSFNTKAFVMTLGLQEMAKFVEACGGKQETVYDLSGIGDLILTACGGLSRNVMVGQRLGKGEKLAAILQQTGAIPESINTLTAVYQLANQKELVLPLITGVYEMVFKRLSLEQFMQQLMRSN